MLMNIVSQYEIGIQFHSFDYETLFLGDSEKKCKQRKYDTGDDLNAKL